MNVLQIHLHCYLEKVTKNHLYQVKKVYSNLYIEDTVEPVNKNGKNVWNIFNMKNLGYFHDLYIQTDILLLYDIRTE